MQRFFGMMPSNEVEIEKNFKDESNLQIRIQAGKNGWTIIWADGGSSYADKEATAESNFEEAYKIAVDYIGELTEVKTPKCYCCCSEE